MDDAARFAAAQARQAEWRARPEVIAARQARIAAGQCVIEDTAKGSWCITHDAQDSLSHHFSTNPGADND